MNKIQFLFCLFFALLSVVFAQDIEENLEGQTFTESWVSEEEEWVCEAENEWWENGEGETEWANEGETEVDNVEGETELLDNDTTNFTLL